ncbi:pectinesterase inhibitor 10-like [Aphis craccivora]|uniref:Pectinesterase inhibitor 10-like n=1 Tax=Aphis craccivora TaxID=307492 RepID=A0A6G0YML2_APHCR|nr:pectinesterase inhibitor 10-like [Aphis craccivora]
MFMFIWYIVSSFSRPIVINNYNYYYPLPSPTTEMDVETQDDVISLTTTPIAKNNCQSLLEATTCRPQRPMFTIRCPIVLQWPFRKSPSSSCSLPTPSPSPSCSATTTLPFPTPPPSSSTESLPQTPVSSTLLPSTPPLSTLPSSIFPSPTYPLPPCPSLITSHTTTLPPYTTTLPPCTTTANCPPSLATIDNELLYELLWMSSATATPPPVRIWTVTTSTSSHLTTYSATCRSSVERIQPTMFVPKVACIRRYNNKVLRF